ncbi:hypothetical protein AB0L13_29565 [Saccharopolyspora shandongensis]|uniref:hypothetical protein n=1 Tax=Saccharopolyspora shandongensis TaxID=418495 RepID=UPI00341D129C
MRRQERRAIEAVPEYLAQPRRASDPRDLARAVGTALGATGCALTVAGDCYRWGARSRAVTGTPRRVRQ